MGGEEQHCFGARRFWFSAVQPVPGVCHEGSWHALYVECGAACALKLALASALGRQHWSCCGGLDPDDWSCSRTPHSRILCRLDGTEHGFVVEVDEQSVLDLQLALYKVCGVSPMRQSFTRPLDPSKSIRQNRIRDGDVLTVQTIVDPAALPAACVGVHRVLVVGGGPVGLWFALALRLAVPHVEVVLCEKRERYRRSWHGRALRR